MTRVLFTSVCAPYRKLAGRYSQFDEFRYRFSRNQEIFTFSEHQHFNALHLLAQNIHSPAVVLEYPTLEDLARELGNGYDYVAISFVMMQFPMVVRMVERIREVSPQTQIVLGGYGVQCLPEIFDTEEELSNFADHVCYGEGISFMRTLLGEPVNGPVRQLLPYQAISLPWLSPYSRGNIAPILSGVGCPTRCAFCSTSRQYGGRYVEILNAWETFMAMKRNWRFNPKLASAWIYDENLLLQRDKFLEMGRYVRADEEFGLRLLNYSCHGSINAIARIDLEEFLLSGVSVIVVGVESLFANLGKLQGYDVPSIFADLHRMGIATIGTWIAGWDFQTPENIEEDLDFFLSLSPTEVQMSSLFPVPGTEIWAQWKAEGRIEHPVRWEEMNICDEVVQPKHFRRGEISDFLDRAYTKVYHTLGPSVLRLFRMNLNGVQYCVRSRNPLLSRDKLTFYRRRCENYFPLLRTMETLAPNEHVRKLVRSVKEEYIDAFGPPDRATHYAEEMILRRAERYREKHYPAFRDRYLYQVFRRYEYNGSLRTRTDKKPYEVTYPRPDPLYEKFKKGELFR